MRTICQVCARAEPDLRKFGDKRLCKVCFDFLKIQVERTCGLSQVELVDRAAQAMLDRYAEFEIKVPDKVIRDALLALYRKRHPGMREPRVVIKGKDAP